MADCPTCEYHKKRAQIWRDEAYRLAGHPLPRKEKSMTQEEIIELARQAGCPMANMMPMYFTDTQLLVMLKAFAKLVAEKERQAIIGLADSLGWVSVDYIQSRDKHD